VLLPAALALLAVLGAASAWLGIEARRFLASKPSEEHRAAVVLIPRGSGPKAVARLLAEAGVVADAERFAWYLRIQRAGGALRAGEFRFFTDMRPAEVLALLAGGKEVLHKLTLPEGLRIEEMAARVEEAGMGLAEGYTRLARDPDFIGTLALGLDAPPATLEGVLLPETYQFGLSVDEEDVVRAQVQRFADVWNERRRKRAAEIQMNPYEVTTLASIVEKETGAWRERPRIAAVFHNRLKKRMPLQSDPTTIYGIRDFDGDIRFSDLKRPHPWNTYVIQGLPPTPIAAPGLRAIDAVLWPDTASRDFFFVSRNDGSHQFSATYEEHARWVQYYQRERHVGPPPGEEGEAGERAGELGGAVEVPGIEGESATATATATEDGSGADGLGAEGRAPGEAPAAPEPAPAAAPEPSPSP
jgi:UPF0755 protein